MELFISNILPRIPGISAGNNHLFVNKHKSFESFGWDIYSIVSALPAGVELVLADVAAIKLNNKLVWKESIRVMNDLLHSTWGNKDEINVNNCLAELTLPIAISVIGAAGFGRKISWREDSLVRHGHKMMFKDALRTLALGVIAKVAIPSIVMNLFPSLRTINLAFDELRAYMGEMIQSRLTSEKPERDDLFTNLLEANDMDDGVLTNDELFGNVFIFLLAGNETTANTLCMAFALLALYPATQQRLFEHIRGIVPEGTEPTYEHVPQLDYVLAVVYETLRMFPPVTGIPKESSEDTTLLTGNLKGEKLVVPVPKGTLLTISIAGVHYNPRYWEDPHEFNPSRFLGDWERDAFLPFAAGARACLGRRFAELEIAAVLCMLVSQYRIEIQDEPQFVGESFEAKKERVLRVRLGLTLTPDKISLTFKRRI
ncbi:hypothetical protein APHAL10511_004844 [Amanita phalloides]|nr:hypothetical protein APHAL10511_004844 [Amanita phalloides]